MFAHCNFGKNNETFVPKMGPKIPLVSLKTVAEKFLAFKGLEPASGSEEEARNAMYTSNLNKEWPCLFFESDTDGEKLFEEFYTE